MNILITGINGFLGRNLIKRLAGHKLYGLGTKQTIIENISVFSSNELDKLNAHIDIVIICHAAVSSGNIILSNNVLYDVNVSLTEKIAHKFKSAFLIYISTVSIFDMDSQPIHEMSTINPQSSYALSKLWGEKVTSLNNKFTILRISSMYGIGMKENTLIPNYINQALENKTIQVWGNGKRLQNYVYVNDVVNYIELIIEHQSKLYGKLVLGVSQKHYSNLELAQMISRMTSTSISFVGEDNSKSLCYNNDFTNKLLNWYPTTNLEKVLQKYIEWKQKKY